MSQDRATAEGPVAKQGAARGGTSFGRILIELGLISEAQLDEALALQQERSRRGDFARLGHLLVELGFLTPEQVQEVLRAQEITILQCEACQAQFNVRGYSRQQRYECPKCHSTLAPAQQDLTNVSVQDQLEVDASDPDDTVRLRREAESNTARIRQLRLLGRYEILGELARGGMGIIYKARQLDLDRVVALKTLRQEELTKPDAAARFLGEAQAVAQLRHPNIVAVYEVGTHDTIQYFTMEFIEGLPLDRRLLREQISPREAVEIVAQVAEALAYAHRQGVVHRDLKPANIILDRDNVPFLVDWGIAKRMEHGPAPDEEEDLLGSIPYMSPEYVEGTAYDELCDLYSLGVVLYEALAGPGALPYYDPDTRRYLERIMTEAPLPLVQYVPDLDPDLIHIVDRMIARRGQRYGSTREAAQALRRWLVRFESPSDEEETPAAAGPGPASSGHVPASTIVSGAIAGVALLGLVYTSLVSRGQSGEAVELRQQLAAMSRANVEQDAQHCLESARSLREHGAAQRALEFATKGIEVCEEASLEPPALAALYELRAELRRQRGLPGADEDARRARELSGQ